MRWLIKFRTSGGGKREVELPATSVSDALEQIEETYKGYKLDSIDLIPARPRDIRIYDYGQQVLCDRSLIYDPFKD